MSGPYAYAREVAMRIAERPGATAREPADRNRGGFGMNTNPLELQVIINKAESASNQAWLLKALGDRVHPADGVHPRDRLLAIRLALQQALEALDRIEEQQEAENADR